jgi:hypothetical protein
MTVTARIQILDSQERQMGEAILASLPADSVTVLHSMGRSARRICSTCSSGAEAVSEDSMVCEWDKWVEDLEVSISIIKTGVND